MPPSIFKVLKETSRNGDLRPLFKVAAALIGIFFGILVAFRFTGLLEFSRIEDLLTRLNSLSSSHVALGIFALLFADTFISVPTLAINVLAGSLLGLPLGALASISGMTLSGAAGYLLGRKFGAGLLRLLLKSPSERESLREAFETRGFLMILVSRALPMLPETTACLAGMTRMSPARFALAWSLGTVPYALIANALGAQGTRGDPAHVLLGAAGLWLLFALLGSWATKRFRSPARSHAGFQRDWSEPSHSQSSRQKTDAPPALMPDSR